MTTTHPRVPRRRPRRPPRSIRLRLTVLYGALFLASGAALLAITYILVRDRIPVVASARQVISGAGGTQAGSGTCFFSTDGSSVALAPPSSCISYGQSLLASQRVAELSQLLTDTGIALAIMTVVSVVLGWLVAGRVLRPLRTITAAARYISASSLNARLAMTGPDDELKELGDTFDGLLGRLEAAFGAQRQFVANASHELRTPLARQRAVAEVALADPQPTLASLQRACQRMLAAGEQQERLIEALLTLARSERGLDRQERLDLAEVVRAGVAARHGEARSRGVELKTDLAPAPTLGDSRLAERLVANLVDNAVRHNVPDGTAWVSTGTDATCAIVSVTNTGPEVPPDQVDRLFQPFQRLRAGRAALRDDEGLGLGLPIVVAIAAAHGAWVRARSQPSGGMSIAVRFPRVPGQSRSPGNISLRSVRGPDVTYKNRLQARGLCHANRNAYLEPGTRLVRPVPSGRRRAHPRPGVWRLDTHRRPGAATTPGSPPPRLARRNSAREGDGRQARCASCSPSASACTWTTSAPSTPR